MLSQAFKGLEFYNFLGEAFPRTPLACEFKHVRLWPPRFTTCPAVPGVMKKGRVTEAVDASKLCRNQYCEPHYYATAIDFACFPQQDLSRETEIKAANGKAVKAVVVFAHALRFFKNHVLEELSDQSATQILEEDIQWVLTVPAIWRAPAKQFMRTAAYEVRRCGSSQVPHPFSLHSLPLPFPPFLSHSLPFPPALPLPPSPYPSPLPLSLIPPTPPPSPRTLSLGSSSAAVFLASFLHLPATSIEQALCKKWKNNLAITI